MLINGQWSDVIQITDRGLQYGDGVFETLSVCDGRPQLWDWHVDRLEQGCRRLGIVPPDREELHREALILCQRSGGRRVLKIIITRGPGGRGYMPHAGEDSTTRILTTFDWPDCPPRIVSAGARLCTCRTRLAINPLLAGIKHLNRLEQVLASMECRDSGCDEGLMLDTENNVIEGIRSNVFIIRDQRLFTPDLTQCGVAGVIRHLIIHDQVRHGIPVTVTRLNHADIMAGEEIFVCNSIAGIWPIATVDGNKTAGTAVSRYIAGQLERFLSG